MSFLTSRAGIALMAFLAIGGYFLLTEHAAHVALAVPYLPYLLLLACPLIHLFMHGGHGHGHGNGSAQRRVAETEKKTGQPDERSRATRVPHAGGDHG